MRRVVLKVARSRLAQRSNRAAMATRLTLAAATATAETAAPLKNCRLGRGLFMVFMVFSVLGLRW